MFSLILPYWDRQAAADAAIKSLEIYNGLDLEIIVVDDGNKVPFRVPESPLNIKVITLPQKDTPKSCVVPWNEGVKACSGSVVILSCIEVLHEQPIIEQMKLKLDEMGKDGYVLASAWCPELNEWHCHSSIRTPRNVWGTGLSFFGMMNKELFYRAGGFDERYREGAGYEDNDFINRLLCVGAEFHIMDELKVIHPKKGAAISWPAGAFEKNYEAYKSKWKEGQEELYTFVCVNWGNYCGRGVEYVNKLYAGIVRNIPDKTFYNFICFSDSDMPGLLNGIKVKPLPCGVTGWWNKLYLFKEGLFPAKQRIIFLDLDTVITGDIDILCNYSGEFATLRDFYHPEQLGPAIMVWKSGFGKDIWESYEKAGYPTDLPMGDLSWINRHFTQNGYKPDILQDLYPNKIKSYKAHKCADGINRETKIVCFHGLPRPHEVEGWVKTVWSDTILANINVNIMHNKVDAVEKNIKSCLERKLPEIECFSPESKFSIAIVGGGPSLKGELETLRNFNGYILATNGAGDFLRQHGIKPHGMAMLDARDENVRFVQKPSRKMAYFMASCVSPRVFDKLKGYNVIVWHCDNDIYKPNVKMFIGGGCTIGTRAICLAYVLGFRDIHLFGMDSCYNDSEHHAYPQNLNDNDKVVDIYVGKRKFKCAVWMAGQAEDFKTILSNFGNMFNIQVHGDGLLKAILDEAWEIYKERNNGPRHN